MLRALSRLADVSGKTIRTITSQGKPGINRVQWNLQQDPPEGRGGQGGSGQGAQRGQQRGGRGGGGSEVEPGTYIVTMTVAAKSPAKPVTVLRDVWLNER